MKKLWILLLPFIIGIQTVNAAPPTKANDFVTQTTIRSSEVNENFDDLYNYLTVGVDTLRTDAVDVITEVKSTIRSGSDQSLVTGTAGSNEEMCSWNGDGDIIGVSTITGNTSGMAITTGSLNITDIKSCTTLGTDSNGLIQCQD